MKTTTSNRKRPLWIWAAFLCLAGVPGRVGRAETNSPIELEPVLVTATRTRRSARDVPAAVRLLDREAMLASDAWTVGDLLRLESGTDVQGGGVPGAAQRFSLRGLTEGYQCKRVLVLVDGLRLNDPFTGNAETALQSLDAAERIELVKGPVSALYGSAAMGGVLSITSRRGTPSPLAEAALEAGSFGTLRWRAAHGQPVGATDYFLTAGREVTDGYRRTAAGKPCDWEAWSVDGNAGWKPAPSADLRALASWYEGRGTDESGDRSIRRDREQLVGDWTWDERRQARLVTRGWRTAQRDRYDWTYPGVGLYRQFALGAEAQQSLWIGDRNQITVGADVREERVRVSDVQSRVRESVTSGALYGQDEILVAEGLRATVGLRADGDNDFGLAWSPRAGLVWRAAEPLDLFVSAGRAYRAPSLSDRYVRAEYLGAWFVGNPDLQPETLWAGEAGARARTERCEAETSLFWNELRDAFDFRLQPDGVFRNSNVTRARTAGVETSVRVRIAREWLLWGNYTYTEGTYEEGPDPRMEGNRLPYLAPHKAAAGVVWDGGRWGRHALSLRHVAARYGDSSNTPQNRMAAYQTVDWRSRVPLGAHAAATLRVDNLTDAEHEEIPHRRQPGRACFGGIEVRF